MNRHEKHLRNLCLIAEDVPIVRAKFASSIVLNNKVVAIGINSLVKSHPLQKKYSKNIHAIYIHSEISAISNALKRIPSNDLRKSTLYVARVKSKSSASKHPDCWGLSKPCSGCVRAALAFGIKRVYYTTDQTGVFECL